MSTFAYRDDHNDSLEYDEACTDAPNKKNVESDVRKTTEDFSSSLHTTDSEKLEDISKLVPGYNMGEFISGTISQVQEVKYIYGKFESENNAFYIMTFIESYDRVARRRIYE